MTSKISGRVIIASKVASGLFLSVLLAGCGANLSLATGATEFGAVTTSSSTAPSGPSAECNAFTATSGATLAGLITDYYYNGVYQSNLIRMRINAIDAQFTSNASTYLQFYSWQVDAYGNGILAPTPLTFNIELGNGGAAPLITGLTSLSANDIASIAQQASLTVTTAQQFFSGVTIVLTGVDPTWTVVKSVLYNGVVPLNQVDSLMPTFTANPNEYAQTHPSILNVLHPFWSMRSQALSDASWISLANNNCF